MEFKRLENEDRLKFIWRVYKYQQDIGGITNIQAGEICRRELNESQDESSYRKLYQYFNSMWEVVKDEYVSEDALIERLNEIDEREDDLFKKKVQTRDWVREKRKLLTSEARINTLKDSFTDAYINAPEVTFDKYVNKHVGEKEGVLLLSDFHVGMDIKNYWNTYNRQEFESRLNTVALKVMKHSETMNIGTLYAIGLGDLISGSIHATTRLAEEMDSLDQVMYVAKAMKNLLIELSNFGLNIKYLSVVGNHDRLSKIYKEHIEKESFNKIVDWYILDKIEDGVLNAEYIYNEIDDGIGHFMINGEHCFAVHGHQDSMNTVLQHLIMASGIIPKYIFMGHYHNKNTLTQGTSKVFVNGSLVGVDEYAKDKRYFSKPSQTLIVFDEDDVIDIELKL